MRLFCDGCGQSLRRKDVAGQYGLWASVKCSREHIVKLGVDDFDYVMGIAAAEPSKNEHRTIEQTHQGLRGTGRSQEVV